MLVRAGDDPNDRLELWWVLGNCDLGCAGGGVVEYCLICW